MPKDRIELIVNLIELRLSCIESNSDPYRVEVKSRRKDKGRRAGGAGSGSGRDLRVSKRPQSPGSLEDVTLPQRDFVSE